MKENVYKIIMIENIITMAFAVIAILGFYILSNSTHSLWGLLILLNLKTIESE